MRPEELKKYQEYIDFTMEEITGKLDWMLDPDNELLEKDFTILRNLIVDYRTYKKAYNNITEKR